MKFLFLTVITAFAFMAAPSARAQDTPKPVASLPAGTPTNSPPLTAMVTNQQKVIAGMFSSRHGTRIIRPDSSGKFENILPEHKLVTPDEAETLLVERKAVMLDIRTADEFNLGHIASAKNIDFTAPRFEERITQLVKNQTYIVHCSAGGRSTSAMAIFKQHGFPNLLQLTGGYTAWRAANKPIEK